MAKIETITVGGEQYNVAQAPAKEQKTLTNLVGPLMALNSARAQTEEIDVNLVMGVLLGIGGGATGQGGRNCTT